MITVKDLSTPEERGPFMDAVLLSQGQGSESERAKTLGIYSGKTGNPANYVISNLDALAPNGTPEVQEVWDAVRSCETTLSWLPGGLPREMQLEWLSRRRDGEGQSTLNEELWARFQSDEEEGGDASVLQSRTISELLAFYPKEDVRRIAEFDWEMAGHPDHPIPIVLPDRLPMADIVLGEGIGRQTAWILLYMLQGGFDMGGWRIQWWGFDMDHIDPAVEGHELTLGNTQLLRKHDNASKGATPLPDFLDWQALEGRMTSERRDGLVKLYEARKADPTGFMDWWLRAEKTKRDVVGVEGRHNDT